MEPEKHWLVVAEPPLCPKPHHEKTAEILFETFNVPAVCFMCRAALTLFAGGRAHGVVLFLGDDDDALPLVVPVFAGHGLSHAVVSLSEPLGHAGLRCPLAAESAAQPGDPLVGEPTAVEEVALPSQSAREAQAWSRLGAAIKGALQAMRRRAARGPVR